MKKTFILSLISLFFLNCVCRNTEEGQMLINESNKAFFNDNSTRNKYITQEQLTIDSEFNGMQYSYSQSRNGAESCSYITYEKGIERLQIGNYIGEIKINVSSFGIELNNNTIYNRLYTSEFNISLDEIVEDITIADFYFENVIILKQLSNNESNHDIDTIIYSKTNGIEFILFEDGSWYKRLDE